MKEILLEHFHRYPQMQLQDAVKLLYQSEFGGGHMITSPEKSLKSLEDEWKGCKGRKHPVVCESIGGGMHRIYIDALNEGLSPDTLNRLFVETANGKGGTREAFEKKLTLLVQCCEQGELPYEKAQAEVYLDLYRSRGCPPVSHSACYCEAYHPAYRVVADCYARYYEAFVKIDQALAEKEMLLISIDGMCAAGKSTMGRILQSVYSCNLFHMDDFFLQPHQRTPKRMNQVGSNVDYERFKEEILDHLGDREGLEYQVYDCKTQTLDHFIKTSWNRLNIVEGSYSQHPYFGDIWDLRFFCEVSPAKQLNRILARNGESMLERFKQEWIPKENDYFAAFGIREKSIRMENNAEKIC